MQNLYNAARKLAFSGAFADNNAARVAINIYVNEHGIDVDREGYVSDNDYADIVHELKG